jgi:hypothetical protein
VHARIEKRVFFTLVAQGRKGPKKRSVHAPDGDKAHRDTDSLLAWHRAVIARNYDAPPRRFANGSFGSGEVSATLKKRRNLDTLSTDG